MIANDVTDLPEPDSPTKPSTSPGAMEKLRSRTAGNDFVETAAMGCPAARAAVSVPCTGNSTLRCRMSSSEGTAFMVAGQKVALSGGRRTAEGGCPHIG